MVPKTQGSASKQKTETVKKQSLQQMLMGLDPTCPRDELLQFETLFNEIMKQKFLGLFLEVEVWNDYKRTCQPVRTPAPGSSAIPGRWFYSDNERQTNTNVPEPNLQPDRNDNDPNACT